MDARSNGQYLILWSVIDSDGKNEKVTAYFNGPHKAADFALENLYGEVQMILCKPGSLRPFSICTVDKTSPIQSAAGVIE